MGSPRYDDVQCLSSRRIICASILRCSGCIAPRSGCGVGEPQGLPGLLFLNVVTKVPDRESRKILPKPPRPQIVFWSHARFDVAWYTPSEHTDTERATGRDVFRRERFDGVLLFLNAQVVLCE